MTDQTELYFILPLRRKFVRVIVTTQCCLIEISTKTEG